MENAVAFQIERGVPMPPPMSPKPEGACASCRQIPQRGLRHCDDCLARVRDNTAQRKAQGLCTWGLCPIPPGDGHTICPKHRNEMLQRNKAMREERKAAGLCIYCHERPGWFGVYCLVCRVDLHGVAPNSLPFGARRAIKQYRRFEAIEDRRRVAEAAVSLLADQRKRQILEMRHGLVDGADRTLEEIGAALGITRERVRQIENVALLDLGTMGFDVSPLRPPFAEVQRAPSRTRAQTGMERKKSLAHKMVGDALKSGEIEKKPCQECGRTDAIAHHPDYDKPLEVEWLCRPHHMAAHGRGKGTKRQDDKPIPKPTGPRHGWWLKKVEPSNRHYDAPSIVATLRAYDVKQKTVCEATGLHSPTINLIVRGREVKDDQLLAVLRFVDELKARPVSLSI